MSASFFANGRAPRALVLAAVASSMISAAAFARHGWGSY